MNNEHIPPTEPRKVIKSFTVDKRIVDWMEKNIPDNRQSAFINERLRRYIKRYEAKKSPTESEAA